MRNPGSRVGRFLNLPAISFMGVLSYSLYLWQQIFLNRNSDAAYCAFPLNIILVFLMAMLSYLVVEAPFLRLRMVIERARRRSLQAPCQNPAARAVKGRGPRVTFSAQE
jgi:peptidoglycan/LPS O-acetylase OafA/YrhL